MLSKVYSLSKWVFTFGQQTTKNQKDIEALQDEVKRMTTAMQLMMFELHRLRDEIQYMKESEAKDKENLLLRL